MANEKERELIRINDDFSDMFNCLDFSEEKRKEYCEAEYEFEKLLETDPEKCIEMYF